MSEGKMDNAIALEQNEGSVKGEEGDNKADHLSNLTGPESGERGAPEGTVGEGVEETEKSVEEPAPTAEVEATNDEPANAQDGDVAMADDPANATYNEQSSAPEINEKQLKEPFDSNVCIVCQENAGKYKCPRCELKYCSVACNKIHKPTHDGEPEPEKPKHKPVAHPAGEASKEKVGLYGKKLSHPYFTLEESEELQWLFKKYPRLPNLLLEIHASTQPPARAKPKIPESLMKSLAPEQRPENSSWSQERQIWEGKAKLKAMRSEEGEDGEAVREYCLLVSMLLNEAYDR